MLVFQRNWEEHIKEYGCKRAGIEFKWLVEVVSEINRYLPDDWRLTRSSNNFRIQIVPDHAATLVGYSYLTQGDKVLHIIDTVHPIGFIDKDDIRHKTGKSKGRVDRSVKCDNTDTIKPNLYFYRPCPAGFTSPLFARQYERIKEGKGAIPAGDEYHRIHPLTRAGLDLAHFRWVRWTINGYVGPVDTVDPGYHGKDYWILKKKPLKDNKKRTSPEVYIQDYHRIIENEGIAFPQSADSKSSPYEIEYKFTVPGTKGDAYTAFRLIPELIVESNFFIDDFDKKAKEQTDTYFDDDRFSLHAVGASFRVRRKKKDNIQVTPKKRRPVSKGFSKEGLYERIEEETVITSSQEAELIAGKPINAFPYRLLLYIAHDCGKLAPKVKVINNRKVLHIRDEQYRKAELCLDKISYEIDGVVHGPYFEIEIESKGAPREKIKELADYLEENLGLIPSEQSKYERGISLLKTLKVPKEKKMVIIDTDCGVDDALAIILALRSPELDVKAITTVSGNVHVDKVIPNVFKVLNQPGLKDRPLVARGADRPLKKDPIIADSVHGKDGLGDVEHIPKPSNVLVDSRPAWQVICDVARQNPKQITLITIGPMTNLALAIQNDPEGVRSLEKVVSMGGVFFNVGNVGPDAEFNVGADPDAAFEVVEFCRDSCKKIPVDREGKEVILPPEPTKNDYERIIGYREHDAKDPNMVLLTFIGLDVTHKVIMRRAALKRAVKAHPGNDLLKFVQDISKKYMNFYYENEWLPGCYLHDPLAVAYVINPSFLEVEKHIIRVETRGQFTSGAIFPDDRPTRNPAWRNPAEEVIGIARNVEREAFEEFFIGRLC
ncbi:MAG: nucleoside hydrolase [Pseudomonadota bacterium]